MPTPLARSRRTTRTLTLMIGSIALFAVLATGNVFAGSAWEKWHDPTWVGYPSARPGSGLEWDEEAVSRYRVDNA